MFHLLALLVFIFGTNAQITVDLSGNGQFKSIQQAINSVSSNNNDWTVIKVGPGTYKEKIVIPSNKRKIVLRGQDRLKTTVEWSESINSLHSATLIVQAEYFLAESITFINTYNKVSKTINWAPAVTLRSDKAAFYNCGFISVQDTLSDFMGRHYFKNCYIEGAIDFIWGDGQSIYEGCILKSSAGSLGGGIRAIVAQGRNSSTSPTGFVFNSCSIQGSGRSFLGRAYGQYSKVLFYNTFISDIIDPRGWEPWHYSNSVDLINFSEVNCKGPGANKAKRVKWEKTLSDSKSNY